MMQQLRDRGLASRLFLGGGESARKQFRPPNNAARASPSFSATNGRRVGVKDLRQRQAGIRRA